MYFLLVKTMENLENRPLEEGEIKELVKKAIHEGKEEARYLLEMQTWHRPDNFTDYGEFETLYGELEKVLMNVEYEGEIVKAKTYILIPKTDIVVLLFKEGNDYNGKLETHAKIYAFSYKIGWKSLELY